MFAQPVESVNPSAIPPDNTPEIAIVTFLFFTGSPLLSYTQIVVFICASLAEAS